jgi:hypothetical protein
MDRPTIEASARETSLFDSPANLFILLDVHSSWVNPARAVSYAALRPL